MTERPEERDFQEGANPDVQGTMNRANTEPPYPKRVSQERVAAIEERLAKGYRPSPLQPFQERKAIEDIRTLINELTELRERNEELERWKLRFSGGQPFLDYLKQMEEALREWLEAEDAWFEVSDARPYDPEVAARAAGVKRRARDKARQAVTPGTETP